MPGWLAYWLTAAVTCAVNGPASQCGPDCVLESDFDTMTDFLANCPWVNLGTYSLPIQEVLESLLGLRAA